MVSRKKPPDPFMIDAENAPLSADEISRLRPAKEVFKSLGIKPPRPVGRPRSDNPKVSVTIRLDRGVVEHFKKDGRGWQTRVNEVLKRELSGKKTEIKRTGSSYSEYPATVRINKSSMSQSRNGSANKTSKSA